MQQSSVESRLILFGRYPVPGQTKTRLIPVLGPLGAAELHRELTEQALATLVRSKLAPVDFVYTGGTGEQVSRWLAKKGVRFYPQEDGDLGRRMQLALDNARAQGAQQVILVGTDVPGMNATYLAQAFDALSTNDVVLGPSEDGGYWLVGCRRPVAVFDGIAWGTPQVLDQTLALARSQGVTVALLLPLNDIDTPEDLRAWRPAYDWRRPYLSVVIPALNEGGRIVRTIEQVRRPGIETVVADGGSRDGTPEMARKAGAALLATPPGRAVQQNIGARQARGRVLMFLHADTRVPDDFDAQVFDMLLDRRVALGAFRFKTDLKHRAMRWIEHAAQLRSRWLKMPYGDQALFMRRSMFFRAGGFPVVPIAEDLFLARTMARYGRICLVPGAAVTSGRRWRQLGILHTTVINYIIAGGCLLGINPKHLAHLYWVGSKRKRQGQASKRE